MPEKNKKRFVRPAEDSFEAYKALILGMAKAIGIKPKPDDDEKIRASWERRQAKKKGG